VLCIVIAGFAATRNRGGELDTSLSQAATKAAPAAIAPSSVPLDGSAATGLTPPAGASDDPLAAAAAADAAPKAAEKASAKGGVPLEQ
jgi:preprotein translocase subunit SecG